MVVTYNITPVCSDSSCNTYLQVEVNTKYSNIELYVGDTAASLSLSELQVDNLISALTSAKDIRRKQT